RSTAIYLRKFQGRATDEDRQKIERRERRRLLEHLMAGTCEPRDVQLRMAGLREGWASGLGADFGAPVAFPEIPEFRQFPSCKFAQQVFAAPYLWRRAHIMAQAAKIVRSGGRASVFSFSLTPVRHHVRYSRPGIWVQTGGLYGRSDRSERLLRWCRFADRLKHEIRRVAKIRGIGES
ncbi:hypothetical protein, partial [Roseibium sp.]|uniref:hypothetical protein n=1 Tax=Roseibium sp. TaxID=1936156 RepID=UPI003D0C8990